MSDMQKEIQEAIKNEIEVIESERYNSKNPIIKIVDSKDAKHVIIKLLTSERTGAPLKLENEILHPAEDLAKRNFYRGVGTLNSWQFKKSKEFLSEAARITADPIMQQRINLYKQCTKLLESVIKSKPDKSVRRTQKSFDDIIDSIKKYDKLANEERNHFNKQLESLYNFAVQLDENNVEIQSQQLLARCSMSLIHNEYLAAYVWLYRIYLLNKEMFDTIASSDEILSKAIDTLKLYLEIETGLKEAIEDVPTIASSFDLQTIFVDYLTEIYDSNFMEITKENLSIKQYKEV